MSCTSHKHNYLLYSCHILYHVRVINIVTYCIHVTNYDMYTTLTLIYLQHYLYYAPPYNGAATHSPSQCFSPKK